MTTVRALLIITTLSAAACATNTGSEKPVGKPVPTDRPAPAAAAPQRGVRPYAQAIPAGARTRNGIFRTHESGGKLLYEIPRSQLEKPFLWVSVLARAQAGTGFGGSPLGNRIVRWELRGDRVLLRQEDYSIAAPDSSAEAVAVNAATLPAIVQAFPVLSFGADSAVVIDVTGLFTQDIPEFSPRVRLGGKRLDSARSSLERVSVFPSNIEVESLLTYEGNTKSTVSALVHHSMVALPETAMTPRHSDSRVGYFSVQKRDYGQADEMMRGASYHVSYITRWRLEKKDPAAAVSEPIKPIVFYIGREIPEQYRAWVKKGIEAWQPAFEAAGFRNAILAKEPPAVSAAPEWSAEDARISSIRWFPTAETNARGPSIRDPRSGEIIEADVELHAGLLDRYRNHYIAQVGEGVVGGQLPDSLEGEIIRSVVTHEVGHALGLQHNMGASAAIPVDSLRSATYTRKHGITASIMDYTRFNYVAQPGDNAIRIRELGPYDFHAIRWGYAATGATTPAAERDTLRKWASAAAHNRALAFAADPGDARSLTEDLGDDPVTATRYGLLNIERSFRNLRQSMAVPGEDYGNLSTMYDGLLMHRDLMLRHVVRLLGGNYWQSRVHGQRGDVYRPVPAAEQRRALRFLGEAGLRPSPALTDPEILRLIRPYGAVDRFTASQTSLLRQLLSSDLLQRLSAAEASSRDHEDVYSAVEYLGDLRTIVWNQPASGKPDLYERELQRSYVMQAASAVNDTRIAGESRALLRAELHNVRSIVAAALPRATSPAVRAHFEDVRAQIDRALKAD